MARVDDAALEYDAEEAEVSEEVIDRCRKRAQKMLAAIKKVNPKQYAMIRDTSPHISALCPRRSGKTYAGAAAALIAGEAKPGSISIIISLNKKQLKRIYWRGGPSGLHTLNKRFGLNIKFNSTELMWIHENGSIGYLLGCEDDEQLEVIRGLEADLYLVDECKSFQIDVLRKLIDEIIDPQRSTREGRLILIGTPGFIQAGYFYEATCDKARSVPLEQGEDAKPFLIRYGQEDPWGRNTHDNLLWSLHEWTLQDNAAAPHQWRDAKRKKDSLKWSDDHPIWVRESLGKWIAGGDGLVFRYTDEKASGKVTWVPKRDLVARNEYPKQGTGLPKEYEWHLVAGLDIGYEAPTAFVVSAYCIQLREFRHVWDFSGRHMLPHEIAYMISKAYDAFGQIEVIYVDRGSLGKSIMKDLEITYGFPVVGAEKHDKQDFIELVNSGFATGEIKIIAGTMLENQLMTNAWDIDDDTNKEELGRRNKLVEDKSIPNDSTDAFIYSYRGAYHRFGHGSNDVHDEPGTESFLKKKEREERRKLREELKKTEILDRLGSNADITRPLWVQRALRSKPWQQITRTIFNSR